MSKEKNYDYFMSLNYDAVLRKKNKDYCLFIPELSIIGCGRSLGDADENLLKEKEKYFRNIIEFNLAETVNEPASVKIRKKQYQEIGQYFLKMLLAFLFIVVLSTVLFIPVLSSFEKAITRMVVTMPERVLPKAVAKIDDKLSMMTEADKEEIRLRIKNIISNIKPYTDEIKILFENDAKGINKPVMKEKKIN